ncbi:hypothetical protein FOA52_003228 [Chlamydomonas sp. UWO 241]|nr:hypothetical protein FOA52_003228 [Chlamydomonas sp. UWO 241]
MPRCATEHRPSSRTPVVAAGTTRVSMPYGNKGTARRGKPCLATQDDGGAATRKATKATHEAVEALGEAECEGKDTTAQAAGAVKTTTKEAWSEGKETTKEAANATKEAAGATKETVKDEEGGGGSSFVAPSLTDDLMKEPPQPQTCPHRSFESS